MNPVLKLVSAGTPNPSESSSHPPNADEPITEFLPGFQARPAASFTAPSTPESSTAAGLLQTGHLLRCARCGELNGRSAATCWNCETDLEASTLPTSVSLGEGGLAANSEHAPLSLPLDLAQGTGRGGVERESFAVEPAVASQQRPGKSSLGFGVGVVAMLMLGAGLAYYYFDRQDSEAAARQAAIASARANAALSKPTLAPAPAAAPSADRPGTASTVIATPDVPRAVGELSAVDAALRAAELVTQSRPDAMGVYVAPSERVLAASTKGRPPAAGSTASAKARAAKRTGSTTTAARPAPVDAAVPTARPSPPAASLGPCTANVAALGLCNAPKNNQSKE